MCYQEMKGGEIFVPKIPSIKILDLAKAIAPEIPIKFIGIRPGEKIKETLCSNDEYINTLEYSKYYIIKPSIKYVDTHITYKKNVSGEKAKEVNNKFEYNSENNKNFLKIKDIKRLLKSELK